MFFKTKDTIPEGLGFSTFGILHLIWLAVLLIACCVAAYIYKKLDTKKRNIMRCILGVVIVGLEIVKDIALIAIGEFNVGYLPFHLCGINILLIAFDLFKPTKVVRNFLYYFCIPGALLALLFPNWTVLPFANFFHIHSFLIHIVLVMYPIMLVIGGDIPLDIKYMPRCIGLLVAMAIPLYFLNIRWDTNFMFLLRPDKGNPLELFEKLLGNHLWGFAILLPLVMFVMYLPILIIKKVKNKQTKETVTVK
ncbi:MAG: YwaF family protein [Clostridia bacterium]|nr:YwaF family protein [Clostridia bacterium]